MVARGLTSTMLVTSDAHAGLVAAIGAALPGASWQRCRTHYAVNLMSITPKSSWPWVRTLLHSVYDQPDREAVHAQYDPVLDALSDKLPAVAEHLDAARADVLAFSSFPKEIWRQIWSNKPQERLIREIRRRTDVVGILPDRSSVIRLIGAVLAEQHDVWVEGRRNFGLEVLQRSSLTLITSPADEEVSEPLTAAAISAWTCPHRITWWPLGTPRPRTRPVELARLREKPIAQVPKDLDIAEAHLRRWMAQADVDEGKPEGLSSDERKELVELRRQKPVLEMGVEILKRASAFARENVLPK